MFPLFIGLLSRNRLYSIFSMCTYPHSNNDNNFRITLDQKIEHSSTEHLPLPAKALSTLDSQETSSPTDNAIQEVLQSLVGTLRRIWGQSYNTFYNLGRCKIRCLNGWFILKEKCNPINILGYGVLTLYVINKSVCYCIVFELYETFGNFS